MNAQQNTPKTPWRKAAATPGFVLYRHAETPGLWQARSLESGVYTRKRLRAATIEEATAQAEAILREARKPALKIPASREAIALDEAFQLALDDSGRRAASRAHFLEHAEAFLQWLAACYPGCTAWGHLTRTVARQYVASLIGAPNTVRLKSQALRQTATFMAREYGFPNIMEGLGTSTKMVKTPPVVHLLDVADFLDWLRDNLPHLEAGAALQGLAGLQLQEALRLDWSKIDLDNGLVEISGEVKNSYRERVIPVPVRVVDALRRVGALNLKWKQKENGYHGDCLIIGERGRPYSHWRHYSGELRKALRQWRPGIDWAPKDLRNAVPTYAVLNSLDGALVEQYIGHAPTTTSARHYIGRFTVLTLAQAHALPSQLGVFRDRIVGPIDDALASRKKKRGKARRAKQAASKNFRSGVFSSMITAR